jgi:enoyl-CoA hydratase/carnithine racemase
MSEIVEYEVAEQVVTITLNRPEALNAVTMDMEDLLAERLRRADDDPNVGAVVVTGAGRGFCAGDDVKVQWADPRMIAAVEAQATPAVAMTPLFELMLHMTTPSVAAVNGPAVGLGMDLALMCDVRLAAPTARFSQGYVRMGLLPDVPGLWLLPRLVGHSVAAQLLLTGDVVDAEEAASLGLVSRVVAPDRLLPEAHALAARIAANPPLAVAATKEGLRRAVGLAAAELDGLAAVRGARLRELFRSEDHREAAAAFAERRPGRFRGR